MLYLLTSCSKPVQEMTWEDVCMRKISNDRASMFVTSSEEGARKLAIHVFGERGSSMPARALTKEELQVLQMRCSGGSVKFVFETLDQTTGVISHHSSVHTLDEKTA